MAVHHRPLRHKNTLLLLLPVNRSERLQSAIFEATATALGDSQVQRRERVWEPHWTALAANVPAFGVWPTGASPQR
jgi:hypothetical protein